MAALNCRPGELAVIVRAFPGAVNSIGKIVRTVRFIGEARLARLGFDVHDVWQVEHRGATERNGVAIGVPDACLRPIRDPGPDDEDEMVRRLGVAPKVFALEEA